MLTTCSSNAQALIKHHAQADAASNAQAMPRARDERNERTYVQPLTLSNYLRLGNARRGAARFQLKVGMAGASRGPEMAG